MSFYLVFASHMDRAAPPRPTLLCQSAVHVSHEGVSIPCKLHLFAEALRRFRRATVYATLWCPIKTYQNEIVTLNCRNSMWIQCELLRLFFSAGRTPGHGSGWRNPYLSDNNCITLSGRAIYLKKHSLVQYCLCEVPMSMFMSMDWDTMNG